MLYTIEVIKKGLGKRIIIRSHIGQNINTGQKEQTETSGMRQNRQVICSLVLVTGLESWNENFWLFQQNYQLWNKLLW